MFNKESVVESLRDVDSGAQRISKFESLHAKYLADEEEKKKANMLKQKRKTKAIKILFSVLLVVGIALLIYASVQSFGLLPAAIAVSLAVKHVFFSVGSGCLLVAFLRMSERFFSKKSVSKKMTPTDKKYSKTYAEQMKTSTQEVRDRRRLAGLIAKGKYLESREEKEKRAEANKEKDNRRIRDVWKKHPLSPWGKRFGRLFNRKEAQAGQLKLTDSPDSSSGPKIDKHFL